jgi:ubiquinone/menaquinone biosynthesis C-methylase UbiE
MSFDRIAPHYRWLETVAFGNALQKARNYWVNEVPRPKRALLVGEGNGRFLCELLRVYPKINVDCVDLSPHMLEVARGRLERLHPESCHFVQFLHCDILEWSPSHSYDLLVTHFFLDCFDERRLESIVEKLADAARDNSIWLIADFTIPSEMLARAHAIFWLRLMYAFFRICAQIDTKHLVDPLRYLESAGFKRISTKLSRWGMLQTALYARCKQYSVSGITPSAFQRRFRKYSRQLSGSEGSSLTRRKRS